nr:hypothetical protein [Pseudoalteromonas sp. OOF1S-7]
MDDRDLNYEKYFTVGQKQDVAPEGYHSHNTERLSVEQVKEVLLSLQEVQDELSAWKK